MLLSLGSTPALAFQEMPEPPPADLPAAAPQLDALQLGTPGGGAAPETDGGGLSLFGYTLMPKFDFGLDALYGQDQQQLDFQQGPAISEENGDVTVLGKVKRRF
jgi:hypothetical protein